VVISGCVPMVALVKGLQLEEVGCCCGGCDGAASQPMMATELSLNSMWLVSVTAMYCMRMSWCAMAPRVVIDEDIGPGQGPPGIS